MSLKIAVLLGGTSTERDVSLVTGVEIAKTLSKKNYYVEAIDCAYGSKLINFNNYQCNNTIKFQPTDIKLTKNKLDKNLFKTINYLVDKNFDLVFNALHGGFGEDGQIQVLLNLADLNYTGSDYLASVLGMNKHLSKILFRDANIPTAEWIHITSPTDINNEKGTQFGFPLVVKPNDQGSTVGLTIIDNYSALSDAVKNAFKYSRSVIIEQYIAGKEITVPILGGNTLPIIEIIPETGIYDYERKYQHGKTKYIVPAKLPKRTSEKLETLALKAFQVLGCRHYARVDFRLSVDMVPFCLEVNTLPGMTPTSLVPKAALSIGIDFSELIERILQQAIN